MSTEKNKAFRAMSIQKLSAVSETTLFTLAIDGGKGKGSAFRAMPI